MRSARIWLWMAAATLAAVPAGADNAKHRDGGGSSSNAGSQSSGGGSATNSHSGGSSDRDRDHATGGSDSPSSATAPSRPLTQAEKDHPRPGTGTGDRRDHRGVHGGYYGGYGRHGGYWDGGIWVVGGGCYDCYDPWYPRYPYQYRYRFDDSVAVRVQVEPDQTRVYVDGYYAGITDDFDGILQRLYITRGQHEIALKLEGFRSHRFVVYGVPGRTIKLHYNMVKGSGEDEPEDLAGGRVASPVPLPPPPPAPPAEADDDEAYGDRHAPDRPDFGSLSLDVRPRDAAIYIDGKPYPQAGREDVRLAGGMHRLEVVRPGYSSFERDVEIKPGKTVDLDVHLDKKQ
jgi:PEGA domain